MPTSWWHLFGPAAPRPAFRKRSPVAAPPPDCADVSTCDRRQARTHGMTRAADKESSSCDEKGTVASGSICASHRALRCQVQWMIQSPTRLKNTSQTTTHHCLVARAAAHPQAIRACIRPRRARRATGATCVSLTLANIDVLQQRKNAVCVALRNARQLGDLQFRCLGWPAHALLAQAAVARLTSRRSLARTLVVAAFAEPHPPHPTPPPAHARPSHAQPRALAPAHAGLASAPPPGRYSRAIRR